MRIATAFALLVLGASAGEAQQRDSISRTPRPDSARLPSPGRTIVGIITDTSGSIVDSAEVFVPSLKRSTSADVNGRFRFDDLKPGEYQVAARRLGFYPQTRVVAVTRDAGGVAVFALVPYTRGLPPVITSSRRGGLSGVIGDTSWAAIKGAEITVVSTTRRALSDSAGAFFMDLPPGKHMVRITRDGYGSQLVSVTVPRDSGRRMMLLLKPATRGASSLEENAIFEMEMRLARGNAVYSELFTREDLLKGPWKELTEIVKTGTGRPVELPYCMAYIDGGPRREFLWAIRASEIEAVEVYRAPPVRAEVRSITGGGVPGSGSGGGSGGGGGLGGGGGRVISGNGPITRIPQPADECQDEVYVWLRK